MIDRIFLAAVNHLFRDAGWAPDSLRPHAGKRARLALGALTLDFSVAPDGALAAADTDAPLDVTISVPPAMAARWLADRDAASRQVRAEGDSEFASAIAFVAANLRWDFEEDLSRLVGDILAHRVGETVRGMERWRRATARTASASLAEYLTEEKMILPTRLQAESFLQEIDDLRDAAERLDKRIARLETRLHR